MTTENGVQSALEIVNELLRDLSINSACRPRFVYLGDTAHDAILKALETIYQPAAIKRVTKLDDDTRKPRLHTVCGLKVRRHPYPWTILVTVETL